MTFDICITDGFISHAQIKIAPSTDIPAGTELIISADDGSDEGRFDQDVILTLGIDIPTTFDINNVYFEGWPDDDPPIEPYIKLDDYSPSSSYLIGITDAQHAYKSDTLSGFFKQTGFSSSHFRNSGYNAGVLNVAGFTASECRRIGYTALQLRNGDTDIVNYTLREETKFNLTQIVNAGYSAGDLRLAGYDAIDDFGIWLLLVI